MLGDVPGVAASEDFRGPTGHLSDDVDDNAPARPDRLHLVRETDVADHNDALRPEASHKSEDPGVGVEMVADRVGPEALEHLTDCHPPFRELPALPSGGLAFGGGYTCEDFDALAHRGREPLAPMFDLALLKSRADEVGDRVLAGTHAGAPDADGQGTDLVILVVHLHVLPHAPLLQYLYAPVIMQRLLTATIVVLAIVVIAWALGAPTTLALLAFGAAAIYMSADVAARAAGGFKAWTTVRGGGDSDSSPKASPPFQLEDFEWADATIYSSPRGDQILQEICFFRRTAGGARRIVDGTAHVGVDTAVLAHSFPEASITAIERDPDVFRVLGRNLEEHGYADRVTTLNTSVVNYLESSPPEADLFYLDPPWGGPDYKKSDTLPPLQPEPGSKKPAAPLHKVVNLALEVAPVVVLKVPHNFEYRSFETRLKGHVVGVTRIKYPGAAPRARAVFLLLEIRKTACREE